MDHEQKPFLVGTAILLMVGILFIVALLVLNSCTVSMTMSHSEAGANDTEEESQATTPTVSPNINVPVSLTPIPAIPGVTK
jgi:hypothetical protein